MKIAIVPGAFFPNPGGAQVQAHNLANKISKLIDQPKLRNIFGKRVRKIAKNELNLTRCVRLHVEMYQRIDSNN